MVLRDDVTEDTLLGGKVILRQPVSGYRAAIDPVLLAAAIPAREGDWVLDIGTGVGAAALCLARRVAGCRVVGLEVQRELVHIATENIALNGFTGRVDIMTGDLAQPPPRLAPGSYDQVMANPPYLDPAANDLSPHPGKRSATAEGALGLAAWIERCLSMARPGGWITLIQRSDRLDALLDLLTKRAGDITIFPLWPFDPFDRAIAKPAARVIVRARVGSHAPIKLLGGMVLHEPDGSYSRAAEDVLREGAALALNGPGQG
jgi:tRNA1(Val) A37 N6-methylase TrmN6